GTLTQPALLTLSAVATQPNCFGQTGSVSLTPNGGTPGYTYGSTPSTNLTGGYYNYSVTDANGCTASADATISVPAIVAGTTSSTPSGCGLSTGSASVTASGGTPGYTYVWSPGGNTNPTASNISAGNYSVLITDSKGCTGSVSVAVASSGSVPPAPVFNDWDGPDGDNPSSGVCGGSMYDFELDIMQNVTSFTWTAPAGAVISDGCGHSGNPLTTTQANYNNCGSAALHPEVEISFPSGFVSGMVTVYASNACGNSPVASWAVQSKPNQPGVISGPTKNLCRKTGQIYSISAVPGAASYMWTVPSGATITNNYGTSIKVTYGNSFTNTGNITVKANNCCGSSTASSLAVSARTDQPGVITGSASVCKSLAAGAYSISAVTGATSYTWTLTGGASFVGSSTGTSVTVKFTTATSSSVTLTVKANNTCGASVTTSKTIAVNLGCRTENGAEEVYLDEMSAYPNPTTGKLNLSFNSSSIAKYHFKLVNLLGDVMLNEECPVAEGNNLKEFDLTAYARGIYFLVIEKESEVRTIRITIE
ncbi:MAG TPA: T9SS type A sorting domain-containing protein, partial [Bacteroidia bacterium]|nr:T9SS type A sorting domain-containing protein [Bacteroidia bacterium]